MIRLTLLGGIVVLGLAAWLGVVDAAPPAPVVAAQLAITQPDTSPYVRSPGIDARDELSLAMIRRCMAVAREVDPELATRLDLIRRDRSEQDFRRAMLQARHLVSLARLQEEDPQLYSVKVDELKLQAQVDRILARLIDARRASSSSAADLEDDLQALVTRQVAFSLVARGFYLRSLEDHVKALRDELDHDLQPANFLPAVQRRYQGLLESVNAATSPE